MRFRFTIGRKIGTGFGVIIISIVMGIAGFGVYLYYLQQGQFEDPEDVKYQVLREKDE